MTRERNCSGCGKLQVYKTHNGFKKATHGAGLCQSCSARKRTAREGKTPHKGVEVPTRLCWGCGGILRYSSWNTFWQCEARNTRCSRCVSINTPRIKQMEETVVRLYNEGISDDQIATEICRTEETVKRVLHKYGLCTTRKLDAKRLQPKIDTYLSLNSNWYRRINRCCIRIKNTAKNAGIPFNLTTDYLLQRFQQQRGLCFYTDASLQTEVGKSNRWEQMSLDRIIPKLGYTQGNVVWCTRRANTAKNDTSLEEMQEWMPGWFARVQNFIAKLPVSPVHVQGYNS